MEVRGYLLPLASLYFGKEIPVLVEQRGLTGSRFVLDDSEKKCLFPTGKISLNKE